jgi:hypothetical protein
VPANRRGRRGVTGLIGEFVDEAKGATDDLVEGARHVVGDHGPSRTSDELADLKAAVAQLTAKVNELLVDRPKRKS